MLFRLYNPGVFQGSLRKKRYFEGWYFKHVSPEPARTVSVIPGVSLSGNDSHAFIQIMNGFTGRTDYIRYMVKEFRYDKKRMWISVGKSEFSSDQITLDIENGSFRMQGQVFYRNVVKYPRFLLSPGIMGWYSFVPFMECNHGIVSVVHDLSGTISINGDLIDFENGKGYIEKDWGVSFPESWIWIQSNNFGEHGTSFSFSVAKIPWMGSFFIGFISFLYLGKKFYLFSTYNGSVISEVSHDEGLVEIKIRNKNHTLRIRVFKNSFGDLKAPVLGEMSRRIKESIDSEVHIELYNRFKNLEYSGTGKNVGLEIIEKIFEYL